MNGSYSDLLVGLANREVNKRAGGDGGSASLPLHEARDRYPHVLQRRGG